MLLNDIYQSVKKEITQNENVKEIILNGGFTGVRLSNDSMGISMNVRSGSSSNLPVKEYLLTLVNKDCFLCCDSLFESISKTPVSTPERFLFNSVIIALLNAMSSPLVNVHNLLSKGYAVSSGQNEGLLKYVQDGDIITIVGYGGMVRAMSKKAKYTYVTELEPELFTSYHIGATGIAKGPNCAKVIKSSEQKEYFAKSNRIFITGCTLVTDTMDDILSNCKGKHIIVYGGTAAFLPDVLFSNGVESIHTLRVNDPELMTDVMLNCGGAAERFFPMATETLLIANRTK